MHHYYLRRLKGQRNQGVKERGNVNKGSFTGGVYIQGERCLYTEEKCLHTGGGQILQSAKILLMPLKCQIIMVLYKCSFCNSNIANLLLVHKVIALNLLCFIFVIISLLYFLLYSCPSFILLKIEKKQQISLSR